MSNFPTSAGVHGGKDKSGVPLKGVSGAEVGEFKMMSLVEIVGLIKFRSSLYNIGLINCINPTVTIVKPLIV